MLEITTPPDPRTGATVRLFDPLDWIHAITAHIPDRGRHGVRYYGAFANRARAPKASSEQQTPPATGPGASAHAASELVQRRRASWARLIQKIFEVDPLLCVCGAEMKIISFITDPRVVDRILRHLESQACRARDPFEPRATAGRRQFLAMNSNEGRWSIGLISIPSFGRSMCVPVGRPMSHESAGKREYFRRDSLNLLSGPQNRVSLPNKVLTSAGLEIECPIVPCGSDWVETRRRESFPVEPFLSQ